MRNWINIPVVILFFFSTSCLAQIQVDAGDELMICGDIPGAILGGSPTAQNGNGPYTYQWTLLSEMTDCTPFNANQFLSLTNVSNPVMISPDLVVFCNQSQLFFEVLVTDQTGQTGRDTQLVTISTFMVGPAYSSDSIHQAGDSVVLEPFPFSSEFPPYTYLWIPATGLDDPSKQNPTASPSTDTYYDLMVTDAAGCTATGFAHEVLIGYTLNAHNGLAGCPLDIPNPLPKGSSFNLPSCKGMDYFVLYNSQGEILGEYEGNQRVNEINHTGLVWLIGYKEEQIVFREPLVILAK